jgi:transcriptional regulator with XRE-family HTH domain
VLDAGRDEAAVALGARVRALRRERQLTLKQLGRAAGLSHPFLSQVERGLARPSVASAERIADALGVRVGSLWADAEPRGAELVRRDDGVQEWRCGATIRTLTDDGRPLVVREWTGGSREWPEDRDVECGDVVLYVARGSIEVDLDGDVHALEEGDALLFDGGVPHRLRRTGSVRTRALRVAAEP